MTGDKLFKCLREFKASHMISSGGHEITITVQINMYSYANNASKIVDKYMTRSLWDKIAFNLSKEIKANPENDCNEGLRGLQGEFEKQLKDKKDIIEKAKKDLEEEFIRHLDFNKDKIIKILNTRIKQVEAQEKKKSQRGKNSKREVKIIWESIN